MTIDFGNGTPYRESITLQWEPRIAADQANQRGSWVVIGGVNVTVS